MWSLTADGILPRQLVLVWTPGKGSPIHDHGNAHCVMKILRGSLTETRYEFPDSDQAQPMRVLAERTSQENDVAYMADELGLHKVENRGSDYAVSLHCRLYIAPESSLASSPWSALPQGCVRHRTCDSEAD